MLRVTQTAVRRRRRQCRQLLLLPFIYSSSSTMETGVSTCLQVTTGTRIVTGSNDLRVVSSLSAQGVGGLCLLRPPVDTFQVSTFCRCLHNVSTFDAL